jgi:hypothetical protein
MDNLHPISYSKSVAEFGVKIMWGKIKKLNEVACVLEIFKKIFFKRD